MYQAVQYVRASSWRVQNCRQAWPFAFRKVVDLPASRVEQGCYSP